NGHHAPPGTSMPLTREPGVNQPEGGLRRRGQHAEERDAALERRLALYRELFPCLAKYCPSVPTPAQLQFLLTPAFEAFFGGSAGGGKSAALLMGALLFVDQPDYHALLIRRTFADLALPGAIMDRMRAWLAGSDA